MEQSHPVAGPTHTSLTQRGPLISTISYGDMSGSGTHFRSEPSLDMFPSYPGLSLPDCRHCGCGYPGHLVEMYIPNRYRPRCSNVVSSKMLSVHSHANKLPTYLLLMHWTHFSRRTKAQLTAISIIDITSRLCAHCALGTKGLSEMQTPTVQLHLVRWMSF